MTPPVRLKSAKAGRADTLTTEARAPERRNDFHRTRFAPHPESAVTLAGPPLRRGAAWEFVDLVILSHYL